MIASQRLWRASSDGAGVSGFLQLGANNSRTTQFATRYLGLGLTAFGLVPERPGDSFGAGLAWSELNQNGGYRRDEVIFQGYDQIQARKAFYLEPALTLSSPGETSARRPARGFTLQTTAFF
jgi:porin